MPSWLQETPEGCVILVHAVPRAAKTEVCGEHNGRLKIKVQAPPVEGAANRNLQKFLSKKVKVSKKSVKILVGEKSREKTFLVSNISASDLIACLC